MIGIIGSGSWATAIVKILHENGSRNIHWWVRRKEVCECLTTHGHNPYHLQHLALDCQRMAVSTDLAAVVAASDLLIVAVPSAYVTTVLQSIPREAFRGKRIASTVKGFVPQEKVSVTQFLEQTLAIPPESVCVISGPSHAEEVAEGQPTFLNVASSNLQLAHEVADILRCSYIHPAITDDVRNIELSGLAKNVYAVAAGMAVGLGYGDNLVAVLTTAAAREILGLIENSTESQILLSDLIVTCFSRHSRNRALGEAVANGITAEAHFQKTGMVAEGYYSTNILHSITKPCHTPIAEAVYRILYGGAAAKEEIDKLIQNNFQ